MIRTKLFTYTRSEILDDNNSDVKSYISELLVNKESFGFNAVKKIVDFLKEREIGKQEIIQGFVVGTIKFGNYRTSYNFYVGNYADELIKSMDS